MKHETFKARRLKEFARQIAPSKGLAELLPKPSALEGAEDPRLEAAHTAVEAVEADDELSQTQMVALEAIVVPTGRPAIDVIDNTFSKPPAPWKHLHSSATKKKIDAVIPSVGRINTPGMPSLPYAGTGFVVGRGLLMTNRHVANVFGNGVGVGGLRFTTGGDSSNINFRHERGSTNGTPFEIEKILLIHPFWDMALLRVTGLDGDHPPLSLSVTAPESLVDDDVVVIGYPAKDYRNNEDLQDDIFDSTYNVKRLQPGKVKQRRRIKSFGNVVEAMTHDCSTLGGNSGSAIQHVSSGDILALHFAGIYMDANFAVPTAELASDPRVVDAGVNFTGTAAATNEWDSLWHKADSEKARRYKLEDIGPIAATRPGAAPGATVRAEGDNTLSVTIPVTITVSIGDRSVTAETVAGIAGAAKAPDLAEAPLETTTSIDPDPEYRKRPGYKPDFLGNNFEIPLPWLSQEQYADAVFDSGASFQRHVMKYHHFSLVMSRERRQAYYTAANIDGRREKHIDRDTFSDKWFLDPRVPDDLQYENDAYKGKWNRLDRGHLVRRLDPVWGKNFAEAKKAHDDTFHWTNCSPQHDAFNRNRGTWGGVENYILNNTNNHNFKATVFTGPIFRDDDPILVVPSGTEVIIPLEFWKVAAMVKTDGELSATAYRISQEQAINGFLDSVEFAFGSFKTFQVPITEIEELTGLSFHHLKNNDPLASTTEGVGGGQRVVTSVEEILL
ncbi:MAG: hypothetical protein GY725_06070 [bacterium]|nr:hypothetical protein [bacterium]